MATGGYYEASARDAIFAEVCLLLISTYCTGMTAHFASTREYYIVGRLQGLYCATMRGICTLVHLFLWYSCASLEYPGVAHTLL